MKKNQIYLIIIAVLAITVIVETTIMLKPRTAQVKKKPKAVAAAVKGKIAIVLDDWGYNLNYLYIAEQIPYPMTMSVLPSLRYSKAAAEELHKRGFEIIMHLPMEPQEKYRLEKNTILTSMDARSIRGIIDSDLSTLFYCKGASNHMGSLATQDVKTMSLIMEELAKKQLYFLDSFVTSDSVAQAIAKDKHVLFARRDVFLDNESEYSYIRQQFNKLKPLAIRNGYAIGIGHARKVTLETLKELIPQMEKEGFKFVFVSDLIK
jgi:polysaccharide deacetylase 2 family uncharacterized protein YibQ